MEPEPTYSVRSFKGHLPEEYAGLVYSKWLRSLRHGNDIIKLIDSDAYYASYKKVLAELAEDPEVEFRLAVLTDTPDVVFGFAACRPGILDYVYVQKDYRNNGIAKSLIPPSIQAFTHMTKTWLRIWPKDGYKHFKFNPFA